MCELASMASCREEMAAEAEDGVDGFEGGEKILCRVLESLPLSFSNPHGLMGVLSPIIQIAALPGDPISGRIHLFAAA